MKETIGEYIRNLRKGQGLTLTKLAAALDIDQSTLSKIENNKRQPTTDILPKLAITFKLNLEELEKEYYSEMIAQILYKSNQSKDLLILAESKAKYFKAKDEIQGNLKF